MDFPCFFRKYDQAEGVGFNDDFKIMFIEVPSNRKITFINNGDLDKDWRNFDNYTKCQLVGDKWYNENMSLLLKVPSAVLPEAFNYVINTEYKDAGSNGSDS